MGGGGCPGDLWQEEGPHGRLNSEGKSERDRRTPRFQARSLGGKLPFTEAEADLGEEAKHLEDPVGGVHGQEMQGPEGSWLLGSEFEGAAWGAVNVESVGSGEAPEVGTPGGPPPRPSRHLPPCSLLLPFSGVSSPSHPSPPGSVISASWGLPPPPAGPPLPHSLAGPTGLTPSCWLAGRTWLLAPWAWGSFWPWRARSRRGWCTWLVCTSCIGTWPRATAWWAKA